MNTRPLDPHERAVLQHLLSAPIEGADKLRQQVEHARVVTGADRGSPPSIDLTVADTAPQVSLRNGPLPLRAEVTDEAGEYLGELLLWVEDHRLASLEYAWVTDAPPSRLPDVASIRVSAE